jgi:hypothetical protein
MPVPSLGPKMMELIEGRFSLAPVIGMQPVGDELLQIIEIGTGIPACTLHLIGLARVFQPQLQVTQHFLGDIDHEWSDFIVLHDRSLSVFQL